MPVSLALTGLVASLALGGAGSPDTKLVVSLNLPQSFADTKAKLQAGGTANILFIGDSLTLREGTYFPYLQTLFQRQYGNAGAGYQPFSQWTGVTFDIGWTYGQINYDTTPRHALDGLWASSTSAPWPPINTGANMFAGADDIDIHYIVQPGGGSFSISPTSQPPLTFINTSHPTNAVRSWSHHFVPTDNRLMWYQPQGDGQICILGQNNKINAPGARMHRAANGGYGVGHFVLRDFSFDGQLQLLEPDLIFIWLGQNDSAYNFVGYVASMNNLVTRIKNTVPNAEIVLIGTYDSSAVHLPTIVSAVRQVASERGVGFLDIYDTGGLYAFYYLNGYLDDVVHFSHLGGRYIAQLLWKAWLSDGASLNTNPPVPACVGDMNLDFRTDGADLNTLLAMFGARNQPRFYLADLNGDRNVDATDLSILLAGFGCDQSN